MVQQQQINQRELEDVRGKKTENGRRKRTRIRKTEKIKTKTTDEDEGSDEKTNDEVCDKFCLYSYIKRYSQRQTLNCFIDDGEEWFLDKLMST